MLVYLRILILNIPTSFTTYIQIPHQNEFILCNLNWSRCKLLAALLFVKRDDFYRIVFAILFNFYAYKKRFCSPHSLRKQAFPVVLFMCVIVTVIGFVYTLCYVPIVNRDYLHNKKNIHTKDLKMYFISMKICGWGLGFDNCVFCLTINTNIFISVFHGKHWCASVKISKTMLS